MPAGTGSKIDNGGEEIRTRPDYDERMNAAMARAQWELGSPSWAGVIIGAFLYPDFDRERLDEEEAS